MRVRFTKSFRTYRKGNVVELGDGEANVLIARGIVELERQGSLLETASVERETRTADVRQYRRKRVTE
jgi:hypothetical protein